MDEYTIIREIGRGGMGCVYEANTITGKRVALKMMSAQAAACPDYREMFEQEALSLKKLNHPSIVKIVGTPYSDCSGNLFLPMEYIEGKTITKIIEEKGGPFEEKVAVKIFIQLLDVFAYIHNKGCIHRDVKPSNIMIKPDGCVCVIDFGIAKDTKIRTGKTIGRIVGTDGYMSPEQANGYNIDHRTDIYSLGCLLHYMLTGKHAIQKRSNDYETICAILENNFPPVVDSGITIRAQTQEAIFKAVDKNMTQRFQSAEEFKTALCYDTTFRVSVGRNDCDITMSGEYISGHHLDIIWDSIGQNHYNVTLIDHSTNGTGINGMRIHNESYSFMIDHLPYQDSDNNDYPQVLIAGLPQYEIIWRDVSLTLGRKNASFLSHSEEIPTVDNTEEASLLLLFLCFLIPLIGFVLYGMWNTRKNKKANEALGAAVVGVLVTSSVALLFAL